MQSQQKQKVQEARQKEQIRQQKAYERRNIITKEQLMISDMNYVQL
jgi:hypothetical protein